MPKTKKTKKKEILIVPVPKPEAPTESERMIAAMKSLEMNEGWNLVVKILDDNIAYLERAIINKKDPISDEVLSDVETDKLRDKVFLQRELKNTPQNYIKLLEEKGEVPENYDPFWSAEDLAKARG
jgi:hypothetical protein